MFLNLALLFQELGEYSLNIIEDDLVLAVVLIKGYL